MRPDTCLDCEHFYFQPFECGYSEYTPGCEASIGCYKDHWCFSDCKTEEDYRNNMLSARECSDFKERKHETTKG